MGRKKDARRAAAAAARRVVSAEDVARVLMASFHDAAATTANNAARWAYAGSLTADECNSPTERQKLRDRARYEVANNSFARHLVDLIANSVVGTMPRLQVRGPASADVESAWRAWSRAVRLPTLLRTMRKVRAVDGEVFVLLARNEARQGVKLTPALIPCECVTDCSADPLNVDGVRLDAAGNAVSYVVRTGPLAGGEEYEPKRIIHWFKRDRAGQHRGVSELTPALEIFSLVREYELSVTDAAKLVSQFTAVVKSDAPPGGDLQPDLLDPGTQLPIARNRIVILPYGWEMQQLKAEQPTTSYVEFTRELLTRAALAVGVPKILALGSSESSNFSSAQLDKGERARDVEIEHEEMELELLDRVFGEWYVEWAAGCAIGDPCPEHEWYWDGPTIIDKVKEATAAAVRLEAGLLSPQSYYAERGEDWEGELEKRAVAAARLRKLEGDHGLAAGSLDMAGLSPLEAMQIDAAASAGDAAPAAAQGVTHVA